MSVQGRPALASAGSAVFNIKVKVRFADPPHARRLAVHGYDDLRAKLTLLYPGEDIVLGYEDADGDVITLGSSPEWLPFLSAQRDLPTKQVCIIRIGDDMGQLRWGGANASTPHLSFNTGVVQSTTPHLSFNTGVGHSTTPHLSFNTGAARSTTPHFSFNTGATLEAFTLDAHITSAAAPITLAPLALASFAGPHSGGVPVMPPPPPPPPPPSYAESIQGPSHGPVGGYGSALLGLGAAAATARGDSVAAFGFDQLWARRLRDLGGEIDVKLRPMALEVTKGSSARAFFTVRTQRPLHANGPNRFRVRIDHWAHDRSYVHIGFLPPSAEPRAGASIEALGGCSLTVSRDKGIHWWGPWTLVGFGGRREPLHFCLAARGEVEFTVDFSTGTARVDLYGPGKATPAKSLNFRFMPELQGCDEAAYPAISVWNRGDAVSLVAHI